MRPVPRLRRSGSNAWVCRAKGLLVTLAAVWVVVLLVFSTFVFVQERQTLSVSTDAQEIERLQRHVNELRNHLKTINAKYERLQRNSKSRSGSDGSTREVQSMKASNPNPKAPASEEKPAKVYDSDTSPVPLVDPTAIAGKDLGFDGNLQRLCPDRHDGDQEILDRTTVWKDAKMGQPRLLCLTYTLSTAHDNAVKNLRQTWGRKCDGYIAMSNITDPTIPSIDIKHEGPEAYNNMWQKSRSIWLYVHKHHLQDFDWFYIGGDDVYLIVENLRKYLVSDQIKQASENGKKPLYLGRRFLPPGDTVVFNSGGAGYVLNRAAVDILGKGLQGTQCRPHQVGFWEDVNVAYCLSLAGVEAYDTRDPLGRERFLPFTPGLHLHYRVPRNPDWYAKYTFDLKFGEECCSQEAVSYHYVKGDLMQRMYAVLYGLCPSDDGGEGGVVTT